VLAAPLRLRLEPLGLGLALLGLGAGLAGLGLSLLGVRLPLAQGAVVLARLVTDLLRLGAVHVSAPLPRRGHEQRRDDDHRDDYKHDPQNRCAFH
jgi:hypothetical protein